MRETLRTRSADAIRTAQASATSVTTRTRFQRRPRTLVDVRVPSFSASDAWVRDSTSAGSRPKRMAVAATISERDRQQAQIDRRVCASRGTSTGIAAMPSFSSVSAPNAPTAVPASASIRLSTSI